MKNNKKAFFFDRDNTLIKDKGYTYKKKDIRFLSGAKKAIRYLNQRKILVIVITNQSGIARNYFKLKDVKIFHKFMNYELSIANAKINDFFICGCHPHFPKKNKNCKCRKPSKTMLIKALKKWSLLKKNVFMIGDKYIDKLSAKNAGINFQYKNRKIDLYKQVRMIVNKKFS